MIKYFSHIIFLAVITGCGNGDNIIQGVVSYTDKVTKEVVMEEAIDVYLYPSIAEFQNHPLSFDKRTVTGPNGYYSLFPLANGPYYVHCEKLDTGGMVIYSGGKSASVSGNETKILDIEMY